ncbi:MAG: DUF3136 domain-containing protein [Cyanobium sp.]
MRPIISVSQDPADAPTTEPPRPQKSTVTIGELEAGYSMYCKAMRLLIREGRSLSSIQRTVCWQRLAQLHDCLPGQYRDPEYLYLLLRRDLGQIQADRG